MEEDWEKNSKDSKGAHDSDSSNQGIWAAQKIERIVIAALVFSITHLRKHPRRQIRKLMHLIKVYGFVVPILIDQDNNIIAGEARVLAAKELGLTWVPAIRIKHLTDPEIRALRIADNRLAELSSWDKQTLSIEIVDLGDLNIDLDLTGFEVAEIDSLIATEIPKLHQTALNDCPQAEFDKPAVTRTGDIWLCGSHVIGCGDARDADFIKDLLDGDSAAQLLVDVPYNTKISGHVGGKGKIKHPEFAMASGEMSAAEFREFLHASLSVAAAACRDGALLHVFIDWRSVHEVIKVGQALGLHYFNLCVWVKTNAGMGSMYRSQQELIVVFKKGSAPHTNNVELGRYGRNRSNVWFYEGANSINPQRRKELALHPTVKPVQLCIDAILDCTARDEIVLDTFLGSGTTLIAAEDCGRVCCGVEISPHYVDVAIRRWEEFTGEKARHRQSGRTFDQVASSRASGVKVLPPAGGA